LNEFYLIAKILSSGKDGFVKAQFKPGFLESLNKIKCVFLDFWNQKKQLELEDYLNVNNSVFLKFKNFDSERDTSLLIDREIFISEKDVEQLNLNASIEISFLGYKVFRSQQYLGIVSDFFETPANPVIEIKDSDGKKILIPFVHSFIDKIDSENKELVLKSDYGIYDDET
jgi:16S rRNA processing protein RimM